MAKAWWRDSDYELFARLTKERDEARAEVERLRREVDEMAAELHALSVKYDASANDTADAYRRGAEAMREACAQVDPYELHRSNAAFARSIDTPASVVRIMQEGIRALPIPGEP